MSKAITYKEIKNYINEKNTGNGCVLLTTEKEFEEEKIKQSKKGTQVTLKIKDKNGHSFLKNYNHFKRGQKQCSKCGSILTGLKERISDKEIQSHLLELNLLFDKSIHSVDLKIICHDKDGYYYKIKYKKLMNPDKFNKSNPYTIQNIKLWCKLNHKPFELLSDKYESATSNLKWKCLIENCQEEFESDWGHIQNGRGCPYCTGMKVGLSNCLATVNPELAKEWHPTKNGSLTPYNVTCGTNKEVWWKCSKNLNHEWCTSISCRNKGTGCPYCSNSKILIGFNDMWTTNPKLASLLANREDGYNYMQTSGKKVDWKCPQCGNIIKNKKIYTINKQGLSCPICSDGISYPEKIMYNILQQLTINFEHQKIFDWCKFKIDNKNKFGIYDFYFKKDNQEYIIETDGRWHYEDNRMSGQTAEESKAIDNYKDKLAKEHNINIIRIDSQQSDLNYIKNNILHSKLIELFDFTKINWTKCQTDSMKSKVIEVWNLWNSGMKSTQQIADCTKLNICTVIKYLKQGAIINKCDYTVEYGRKQVQEILNECRVYIPVICLNTNKIFKSISDAYHYYNLKSGNGITNNCKGLITYSGKDPLTNEKLRWAYYKNN